MTKDEFEGQNFSLAVLFVLPLRWKREEDAAIRARQQPALLEQLRIPRRCLRMRSRARQAENVLSHHPPEFTA